MRALYALNCTLAAGIVLTWTLLAASPALGQATYDSATTIVVGDQSSTLGTSLKGRGFNLFNPDFQAAVSEAIGYSTGGAVWTVLVLAGGWSVPPNYVLTLGSDDNIQIVGYPQDAPQSVFIQGVGVGPVITVKGMASRLLIEGIAPRGGSGGIKVESGTVDLARCYIVSNQGDGVYAGPGTTVSLVNCSVSENGTGHGIHAAGSATVTVDHCSVLRNGSCGVFAEAGSRVSVNSSLIYKNVLNPTYTPIADYNMDADPAWTPEGQWQWGQHEGLGGAFQPGGILLPDPGTPSVPVSVYGVNREGNYFGTQTFKYGINDPNGEALSTGGDPFEITVDPAEPAYQYDVGDVNVLLDVDSVDLSQLQVFLEKVGSGISVPLWQPGGSATGTRLGATDFNDEGIDINSGSVPTDYAGSIWPTSGQRLRDFDGQSASGTWRLRVIDPRAGTFTPYTQGFTPPGFASSFDWSGDWQSTPIDAETWFGPGTDYFSFYNAGNWDNYQCSFQLRVPDSAATMTVPWSCGGMVCADPAAQTGYGVGLQGIGTTAEIVIARISPGALPGDPPTITPLGSVITNTFAAGEIVKFSITAQGSKLSGNVLGQPFEYDAGLLLGQGTVGFWSYSQNPWPGGASPKFNSVSVKGLTGGVLKGWSLIISPPGAPYALTMNPLDLSSQASVRLGFKQFVNMGVGSAARLEVTDSSAGGVWARVPGVGRESGDPDTSSVSWTDVQLDVSSYVAGKTGVQFRWVYGIDLTARRDNNRPDYIVEDSPPASGWNIDDVAIEGATAPFAELAAESGGSLVEDYDFVFGATRLRENVAVGANSLTGRDIDTFLDSRWIGSIVEADVNGNRNPLVDIAGASPVKKDFEWQNRSSSSPDVGADEVGGSAEMGVWADCDVTPNPVGAGGTVVVDIEYSPSLDFQYDEVFIVPQGIDPANGISYPPMIRLNLEEDSPPFYSFRSELIDTFVGGPGGNIADGHAVVCIRKGTEILYSGGNTVWEAAAESGRHFLIDTIPPRWMPNSSPDGLGTNYDSTFFFSCDPLNGDPFAALGVAFGSLSHPYPAIPLTFQQMGVTPKTGAPLAPPPVAPLLPEIHAFYNATSISNGYSQAGLTAMFDMQFVDPDVYTAKAIPRDPLRDTDLLDSRVGTDRQVAGFTDTVASGDASTILNGTDGATNPVVLSAYWAPGDRILPGVANFQARLNMPVTAIAPFGGGHFNDNYSVITARWFLGSDGSNSTILATQPYLEIAGRPAARDRAGNTSDDSDFSSPTPLLHLWWLRGHPSDMVLEPKKSPGSAQDPFPDITWGLTSKTGLTGDPRPLYNYRVYMSDTPGNELGRQSTYVPVTSQWAGWSPKQGITRAEFEVLNDGLGIGVSMLNRWVMVLIGGVDEAGNVTPIADLDPDPGVYLPEVEVATNTLTFNTDAEHGANWIRFFVEGDAGKWDTTLSAKLGYDDDGNPAYLPDDSRAIRGEKGPVRLITYPPTANGRVEAVFDIGTQKDPTFGNTGVLIELEQDGELVYSMILYFGLKPSTNQEIDRFTLRLPHDLELIANGTYPEGIVSVGPAGANALQQRNGHMILGRYITEGGQEVARLTNFVFRAGVIHGVQPDVAFKDPSPAQFSFKVVPGAVENYMESGAEEPVKTYEIK